MGGAVQVIPADRATHAQKWTAETCEHEKLTLDPAKHELFWSTSVKAVGAINGPLHFIGDDQARTSVEQNVLMRVLHWLGTQSQVLVSSRTTHASIDVRMVS